VLGCIDKRLVIYLEDIDRGPDTTVFYGEIASLLDRLKALRNVSFVLAVGQDIQTATVITRISEHVEVIPALPAEKMLRLCMSFRKLCLTQFEDDIDPQIATREKRVELEGVSASDLSLRAMFASTYMGPMDAISNLLSSPRIAKTALRRTWMAWQSLHGEIDFDDLFAANVLRSAALEAYAFLSGRISELRRLAEGSIEQERKSIRERLLEEWNGLLEDAKWDRRAATLLLEFMFPRWKEAHSSYEPPVQGITVSRPDDYWVRLNEEELPKGALTDQKVLRDIAKWGKSPGDRKVLSDLAWDILYLNGYASKFEQFGKMIEGADVRSLAAELFEIILQSDERAGNQENYHGFIELWRLAIRKPVPNHEDWVFEQIKKALPVDLHFAIEIYYYWRTNNQSRIETREATPELRRRFVVEAMRIFRNPATLIKAVNQKDIWSIFHLVAGVSDSRGGFPEYDPVQFKEFGKVLLQSLNENPLIMLPQIAALITTYAFRGPLLERSLRLDENKIHDLFEGEEGTLMQLLTTDIDLSTLDDDSRSWVLFTQEEARRQVAE